MNRNPASTAYEARILRVLDHIHRNPTGDLSLDALADVAAMSRFHWHRVFYAMTGETCADAVRRIRLRRAPAWHRVFGCHRQEQRLNPGRNRRNRSAACTILRQFWESCADSPAKAAVHAPKTQDIRPVLPHPACVCFRSAAP